jgi:hypothetical protein
MEREYIITIQAAQTGGIEGKHGDDRGGIFAEPVQHRIGRHIEIHIGGCIRGEMTWSN